jgi:hypothetical protein
MELLAVILDLVVRRSRVFVIRQLIRFEFESEFLSLEADIHAENICGTVRKFLRLLKIESLELLKKNGAGDGDRTRNIQLGKLTLYH